MMRASQLRGAQRKHAITTTIGWGSHRMHAKAILMSSCFGQKVARQRRFFCESEHVSRVSSEIIFAVLPYTSSFSCAFTARRRDHVSDSARPRAGAAPHFSCVRAVLKNEFMITLKTKVIMHVLLFDALQYDTNIRVMPEYLPVPEECRPPCGARVDPRRFAIRFGVVTEKKWRLTKIVLAFLLIVCYKISIAS